jgi:hypothetical protein
MDPTGRFVAGWPLAVDAINPPVLWDGGSPATIPLVGKAPRIYDINSSGVAAGTTDLGDEGAKAFVIEDGVATLLNGQYVTALSINESGTIVGKFFADRHHVPVLWRPGSAEPEFLRMLRGLSSVGPIFIDDDGTIVAGMTGGAAVDGTVVLWGADGVPVDLGPQLPTALPNGDPVPPGVTVVSYRGGWISLRLGETPVLWNYRTGESRWLDTPGPSNGNGWHVGDGPDGPVLDNGDGGLLSLPAVPDVIYGAFTTTDVVSLSDDGRTITGTINGAGPEDGDVIPVIWHCS